MATSRAAAGIIMCIAIFFFCLVLQGAGALRSVDTVGGGRVLLQEPGACDGTIGECLGEDVQEWAVDSATTTTSSSSSSSRRSLLAGRYTTYSVLKKDRPASFGRPVRNGNPYRPGGGCFKKPYYCRNGQ